MHLNFIRTVLRRYIRALATANFTYALPLPHHTLGRERGSMNNSPSGLRHVPVNPYPYYNILEQSLPAARELPVNPPCIDVVGKFNRASPWCARWFTRKTPPTRSFKRERSASIYFARIHGIELFAWKRRNINVRLSRKLKCFLESQLCIFSETRFFLSLTRTRSLVSNGGWIIKIYLWYLSQGKHMSCEKVLNAHQSRLANAPFGFLFIIFIIERTRQSRINQAGQT